MARILVVDDEKSIRLTVSAFLRGDGHEVVSAEDAEQALQILHREPIDVVLSDIILPRFNGVELLKAIREAAPRVQVIMMTGEPTVSTATEALRAGALDYLSKPVTKEAMVRAVSAAVKVKVLDDERLRLAEENREYQQNLERMVEQRTRDLREREQQLRQAQKMEAIGKLAGGVAHDFNNLLTVIGGSAQFLMEEQGLSETAQRDVKEIASASVRAAKLTRQLLAFSRQQELTREKLDLRDIVQDVARMLRRLLGEDVVMDVETVDRPCVVDVDPGQMEQVIMNLTVNARDAMPKGGRLLVEVGHAVLCEDDLAGFTETQDMAPGPHVTLSVTDTGSGMDEATRNRIFDPFFTTKAEGEGTGLGLSTVYGIVKQHRGHISVYSEPGEGASFRAYLPEAEADVDTRRSDAATDTRKGRGETVLCVEDNDAVSLISVRLLRNLSYSVLSATDAQTAVRLAEQHRDAIQLLLTDVIMPDTSGPELAQRVQALCPAVKVVYTSGYPAGHLRRHGLYGDEFLLLRKPFVAQELATMLRRALGS